MAVRWAVREERGIDRRRREVAAGGRRGIGVLKRGDLVIDLQVIDDSEEARNWRGDMLDIILVLFYLFSG